MFRQRVHFQEREEGNVRNCNRDLYKSFDTKDGTVEALKNVNLSIESGDIYGIIGMSGAGKSTLVRCINFLEVPNKGTCPY